MYNMKEQKITNKKLLLPSTHETSVGANLSTDNSANKTKLTILTDSNIKESTSNMHHQSDNQSFSNSENNKISIIQTSPSRVAQISNFKIQQYGKRLKTSLINYEGQNNSERATQKKQLIKRLKTQLTGRPSSRSIDKNGFSDEQNPTSLAELLEFHTGYHDIDQQQFNIRVKREKQGSNFQERKASEDEQQKKNSIVDIYIGDEENQADNTQEDNEQSQQQLMPSHVKSFKQSKQKKSKVEVEQSGKKQQIALSNKQSSSQNEIIESIYSQGVVLKSSLSKAEKKQLVKRPKIRSYSHEDKLKIISEAKYVPKSEQQIRMQARYLKSQISKINQIRQVQEMAKIMLEYQNNKRNIQLQSCKKMQISKMMNNLKSLNNLSSSLKKSVSLPKIKLQNQFVLPNPDMLHKKSKVQQEDPEYKKNLDQYLKLEKSLSANRLHYKLKTQQSALKKDKKQSLNQDGQSVYYIYDVLKSKGLQLDINVVRKGVTQTKVTNELEGITKLELPRNLISNPKYKKYPL